MAMKVTALLKLALLLTFLALAVYLLRFTETGRSITPARFKEFVESVDPRWAPLIYVAIYIVGTVVLVPGAVMSFAGAILFGAYLGTLYTWIGATIGATLAFLTAKLLGRDFVDRLLRGKLKALDARLREHGFRALLVLRLVALFPFNGLNFGCGLTGIRFQD